ncbi:hypothetical protein DDE82_008485 [Stemphylium lycopersici]|uniref:DUF7053 domain-containing protein n=1 Tax=Stemphylium lycopersici TaxID=183478 RepID=A0A364MWX4_STELY|nr:hypothetical protein TW65_81174 [Stemphylium lycopersici]RAQ99215.1 hypothetical protein DDE82_008485 [Stemphylium lycopersici]RAR06054.1 hypothetical protein DDE83_007123 [Stemphylium lycopersici]
MSSKHNLHVASRIPRHMSPTDVIAALHDHETALTLQALTCGHEKAPSTAPGTLKDTYWYPPDQYPITTYHVTECITWFPGIGSYGKKYIKFPSCFQDTRQGIKTRADAAAGVIVRAEFRVVANGEAGSEVEGEGMGVGDAQWILVEDVEVTCSWWLMPFVKGKMEEAHRDVCDKIIAKVEQRRNPGWAGNDPIAFGEHGMIKRQDSKADGALDINTGFAQETRNHYGKPQPVVFGQTHLDASGPVEADALEAQRAYMPAAPLPDKIIYR